MTTVPVGTSTAGLATPKRRVPLWDNARFVCVALVVIGHGVQRLTSGSDNALAVYLFIYAFHMPAFAIISGYFSKASPPSSRQMKKVVTDIILPYAIMQTIWSIVQFFVEGSTSINPTTPHWTLWFLLALGIFRLLLPYLALLKWPLLWALIASIGIGYFNNVDSTFSLARAIGILPFFVLGWQLRQWKWMDLWVAATARQALWIRGAALAVFGVWGVVVLVALPFWNKVSPHWFFYDDSYDGLGHDEWWAGFTRLALILLAVILSAALLVLIPRSTTWITTFGQSTMYVYLLHSFILYPLRETGVLKGEHSSAMWLVSVVLAGIAISIALSSPIIRKIFWPVIEPKPEWLFIPLDDAKHNRPDQRGRVDPTGSRREPEVIRVREPRPTGSLASAKRRPEGKPPERTLR